jgi:20S proteasome subunit alpha 2
VAEIGGSIGAVYAGMPPDFRVVLKRARKAQTGYVASYREAMPVRQLVLDSSGVMQEFTQRGGVRPFGISVLVAGIDAQTSTPSLFQVDPSGAFFAWKATAVGRNFVNSKVFLEKRYSEDMEIEDAIHTALLCLKESFEGAMNEHNVEIGVVTVDNPVFTILTPAQLKDYLAEIL